MTRLARGGCRGIAGGVTAALLALSLTATGASAEGGGCDPMELRTLRILVEQIQLSRARGEAANAELIARLAAALEATKAPAAALPFNKPLGGDPQK